MKKITILDILIISVIIIAVLSTISYKIVERYKNKKNGPDSLKVITPDGEYVYSINQKKTVKIEGQNGITAIEIDNGKFHFADSECPNKDCVRMGWVSIIDYPVVCLPNQVSAYIISNDKKIEFDGISQ